MVLNPLRVYLVKDPGDWKWSTYRATIGYDPGIFCLTTDWLLSQFGQERKRAASRYQAFVLSGIKAVSPLKEIAEYIGLHDTTLSGAVKKSREKMKSDIARPDPIICEL